MKPSRYNLLFQAQGGAWLLFNGWSTALAEIEEADLSFIQAFLKNPDTTPCDTPGKISIREALIEGHFLVEEEEDELVRLKAETMRDRFRTDQLHLTIAPTLDCNFRCDYCYEEHLRVTMSRPVQEALLHWVEQKAGTLADLFVCWFGGEPLLPRAGEVVEKLSQDFQRLAARRGIEYQAQLVTNGWFLDRSRMQRLAELGVVSVQVTLDGPPAIHDQRRILAGGQGTFERILKNLKETVDLASFQIRINVDQRNAGGALDLAELLDREGVARKARLYLAMVTHSGAACGNILESCYSSEDYAREEVEILRHAARRRLPVTRYPFRLKGAFCTADRVNGLVVAPSGDLFKCWHEVTMDSRRAVGHLLDGQREDQRAVENRWLAWNTFEKKECPSCPVLPLCHGGCPLEALKQPDSPRGACEAYKFQLKPLLEVRRMQSGDAGRGPASRGGAINC